VAAAAVTPTMRRARGCGPLKNGWKLLISNPVERYHYEENQIASLITTMIALVVADSRVPRISNGAAQQHSSIGGQVKWRMEFDAVRPDTIIGERSISGSSSPMAFAWLFRYGWRGPVADRAAVRTT